MCRSIPGRVSGEELFLLELDGTAYVIDSTTIELCLSLFPWARLVKKRAAVKLHLGLSLTGNIPSFFDFSSGKEHYVFFLDRIEFEQGAYYVMDRGYLDSNGFTSFIKRVRSS